MSILYNTTYKYYDINNVYILQNRAQHYKPTYTYPNRLLSTAQLNKDLLRKKIIYNEHFTYI